MEISHTLENGICIILFRGNLALAELEQAKIYTDPWLKNAMVHTLIMNCQYVEFIGSSGLGFITACYKKLLERNARLVVTNLSSTNADFFRMTGLDKRINVFPFLEDALNSFK